MLQALADTVRSVFGARAVSILLTEEDGRQLRFAAVSGDGEQTMTGRRIAANTGLAGWVLAAGQPLVVEDASRDPRFAADFARSTGYVPKGIMTAPILGDPGPVGVVSVLDRPLRAEFSLIEVELLERFCHLISLALSANGDGAPEGAPIADLAGAVAALPPRRRAAAEHLLDALTALLES